MDQELQLTESESRHSDKPSDESDSRTWITPDFVEVATCAEICAYVFVAK